VRLAVRTASQMPLTATIIVAAAMALQTSIDDAQNRQDQTHRKQPPQGSVHGVVESTIHRVDPVTMRAPVRRLP
jgi:hypothetical protein